MSHMIEGKQGIVLGSGKRTNLWKLVGWQTLDINPSTKADYIANAKYLEEFIPPQSQDFVFAERIVFNHTAIRGIVPARLLQQANIVLKTEGILIIETMLGLSRRSIIPSKGWFSEMMICHGFSFTTELYPKQDVFYYGQKVANGFDLSRIK